MRIRHLLGCACALLAAAVSAEVPVGDLYKPPAGATHYVIQSTGGKHGDSWMWTGSDGTRYGRESMDLRGQVTEVDSKATAGSDGMPAQLVIRGRTPSGDAAETFSIATGKASWQSPVDAGGTAYTRPAFYAAQGGPFDLNAWFADRLLARPGQSLDLLPAGRAHAVKLSTLEVGGATAPRKTIALWAVSGLGTSPIPIWADADNHFFALTLGIGWLPEAYASEQQRMEEAQTAALSVRTADLAHSLGARTTGPVAFTHVRLFDADGGRFLDDQTVVVSDGLIRAVGPAAKVAAPAGARIIAGRGMTLLPGLWDCHMHVGDDYTGLQELSLGVTSVRDPGNNDAITIDRRQRAAAGNLLFPHVHASSLIDGKGPYTAQVANVATSEAEAIEWVDKAKAKGMEGVKFYGTFNPAWLPAAIAEAHRLGLHVHGHVPAGIRPLEAINDGYDELTHINWVIMQAMPDSVIRESNGIQRFEGPGRYGKDVDLDGPQISAIVGTMAKKHIYSDPTMSVFESTYVPDNGDLSPAYAPFVGTLPPTTERGFRAGGLEVPKDLTRADYRASWAKMVALLGKMHRAGIPIVAGTDGSGIELVRELEIYAQAGFTAAEALAAATIVPARLTGVAAHTGSIRAGKAADLVLVEGDPSQRLADLRQTRLVMLDGRLLDADRLREAAGYAGRPK